MFLMHKDVPVADVTVRGGSIISVNEILNREHYPLGAFNEHKQLQAGFLNSWQKMRAISSERQEVSKIVAKLGCSLSEAAFKNMALSLTDCYWFRDEDSLTWNDVNYHTNGFSANFAEEILRGDVSEIDFKTPDFTTDGVLKKFWISLGGVPNLVKYGDFGEVARGKNLLSANEVVASRIAEIMQISHVNYSAAQINGSNEIVSICPCFITNSESEFVNGLQIEKEFKMDLYHFLIEHGMQRFLDDMLTFDFIIGNTDRHTKNFGLLRNPDTLEFISPAPLFDSGSCLGWDGEYDTKKIFLKPFDKSALGQLEMIGQLPDIIPSPKEAREIIESVYQTFGIPAMQCELAVQEVVNNLGLLARVKDKRRSSVDRDDKYEQER